MFRISIFTGLLLFSSLGFGDTDIELLTKRVESLEKKFKTGPWTCAAECKFVARNGVENSFSLVEGGISRIEAFHKLEASCRDKTDEKIYSLRNPGTDKTTLATDFNTCIHD
jgi:hypothetical protein